MVNSTGGLITAPTNILAMARLIDNDNKRETEVRGSDEQDERERIGHIISELRKDAGLSQTDLAKKIGSDRSYISKIERGRQHISINVLTNIAAALGARVEVVK